MKTPSPKTPGYAMIYNPSYDLNEPWAACNLEDFRELIHKKFTKHHYYMYWQKESPYDCYPAIYGAPPMFHVLRQIESVFNFNLKITSDV